MPVADCEAVGDASKERLELVDRVTDCESEDVGGDGVPVRVLCVADGTDPVGEGVRVLLWVYELLGV